MKTYFIAALIIGALSITHVNAQDLAGAKLLNWNLSVNGNYNTSISDNNGTTLTNYSQQLDESFYFGYSKVNNQGIALGYWLSFTGNTEFQKSMPYTVGGNAYFTVQKYKKIADRFYLCPNISLRAGYAYTEAYYPRNDYYNKTNKYSTSFGINAIAFAYKLSDKYLVSASFGSAGVTYGLARYKNTLNTDRATNHEISYNLNLIQGVNMGFAMIIK